MLDAMFVQACEDAAARFGVPALALAIHSGGRTETLALGCDATTRFRIASVTKPFTATAALRLLPLEAQVGIWPATTVGDVLAHLSGYEGELGDLGRFGEDDQAPERLAEELPTVVRLLPARDVWSYSNAGYWLAGLLVARAADAPYEEVIAGICREAGLAATSFDEPDVAGTGPEAHVGRYPRARRPSGGLVSTAVDVLAFGRWLLAQPELARMRTALGRPVSGVYGFGLGGERVGGVDVWGHDGSYGGFQSRLSLVADRDAVFAGLTNSGRGKRALRQIENAWLDATIGARRRVQETIPLRAGELARFAGAYANSSERVTVTTEAGDLRLQVDGVETPIRARPIGPRAFEAEGEFAGDRFDFPRAGFARGSALLAQIA